MIDGQAYHHSAEKHKQRSALNPYQITYLSQKNNVHAAYYITKLTLVNVLSKRLS